MQHYFASSVANASTEGANSHTRSGHPYCLVFLRRLESCHLVRGTPKEQVHAN